VSRTARKGASWWACLLGLAVVGFHTADVRPSAEEARPDLVLVEDFEGYRQGDIPTGWKHRNDGRLVDFGPKYMDDDEYFVVKEEEGRRFLRGRTDAQALSINRPNGNGYVWNTGTHPVLRWDWRAHRLPAGAREDKSRKNDAGAAVYVVFTGGWRPRIIKYTYSSTLASGTTASYGRLKVLVVASGRDGLGQWQTAERDVTADYRRLFDREPPREPVMIMLWSDSDTVKGVAEVDFDNIVLLPARSSGRPD